MGSLPPADAASRFSQPSTSNLTVDPMSLRMLKSVSPIARIIIRSVNEYEDRSEGAYARSMLATKGMLNHKSRVRPAVAFSSDDESKATDRDNAAHNLQLRWSLPA